MEEHHRSNQKTWQQKKKKNVQFLPENSWNKFSTWMNRDSAQTGTEMKQTIFWFSGIARYGATRSIQEPSANYLDTA